MLMHFPVGWCRKVHFLLRLRVPSLAVPPTAVFEFPHGRFRECSAAALWWQLSVSLAAMRLFSVMIAQWRCSGADSTCV